MLVSEKEGTMSVYSLSQRDKGHDEGEKEEEIHAMQVCFEVVTMHYPYTSKSCQLSQSWACIILTSCLPARWNE